MNAVRIGIFLLASFHAYCGAPAIEFKETVFVHAPELTSESVSHAFEFENTGDAELVIYDVKRSCGCVVFHASARNLAPGESGLITLGYNPTRKRKGPGEHNFEGIVLSNAANAPATTLALRVRLGEPVYLAPESVEVGTVAVGESKEITFSLYRHHQLKFDADPAVDGENLRVTRHSMEREDSFEHHRFEALYTPASSGAIYKTVRVRTGVAANPELQLVIQGAVGQLLTATPPLLRLAQSGTVLTASTTIERQQGAASALRLAHDNEDLEVWIDEAATAPRLSVSIPAHLANDVAVDFIQVEDGISGIEIPVIRPAILDPEVAGSPWKPRLQVVVAASSIAGFGILWLVLRCSRRCRAA